MSAITEIIKDDTLLHKQVLNNACIHNMLDYVLNESKMKITNTQNVTLFTWFCGTQLTKSLELDHR